MCQNETKRQDECHNSDNGEQDERGVPCHHLNHSVSDDNVKSLELQNLRPNILLPEELDLADSTTGDRTSTTNLLPSMSWESAQIPRKITPIKPRMSRRQKCEIDEMIMAMQQSPQEGLDRSDLIANRIQPSTIIDEKMLLARSSTWCNSINDTSSKPMNGEHGAEKVAATVACSEDATPCHEVPVFVYNTPSPRRSQRDNNNKNLCLPSLMSSSPSNCKVAAKLKSRPQNRRSLSDNEIYLTDVTKGSSLPNVASPEHNRSFSENSSTLKRTHDDYDFATPN